MSKHEGKSKDESKPAEKPTEKAKEAPKEQEVIKPSEQTDYLREHGGE
jgi:hypothetical protein